MPPQAHGDTSILWAPRGTSTSQNTQRMSQASTGSMINRTTSYLTSALPIAAIRYVWISISPFVGVDSILVGMSHCSKRVFMSGQDEFHTRTHSPPACFAQ